MNKNAFTLTEMLIVLIIISSLMFLVIPNISKSKKNIDNQTCDAYIILVESQIQAYIIENGSLPIDIDALVNEGYIQSKNCPNGELLEIIDEKVQKVSGG